MNKKLIIILSSIILLNGLVIWNKDKNEIIKNTVLNKLNDEDLKIAECSYSERELYNIDKNKVNFNNDITNGGKDHRSKKAVNINLREGQSLKIETEADYPITTMLKDNSKQVYIFNKTSKPVNNAILIDEVKKDGEYELTVDFNAMNEFNFKVYISN